jgi:hypothetical protein
MIRSLGSLPRAASLVALLPLSLLVLGAAPAKPPGGPPPTPPPRAIPGITAADQFPRACVDCHVNRPEIGLDVRLSTIMKDWAQQVDPGLLSRLQAAGMQLNGKHPPVAGSFRDVPSACLKCHHPTSKSAPAFAQMMHVIHLTGGEKNHFMTHFQGECTHCHKLAQATGRWTIPSGPER